MVFFSLSLSLAHHVVTEEFFVAGEQRPIYIEFWRPEKAPLGHSSVMKKMMMMTRTNVTCHHVWCRRVARLPLEERRSRVVGSLLTILSRDYIIPPNFWFIIIIAGGQRNFRIILSASRRRRYFIFAADYSHHSPRVCWSLPPSPLSVGGRGCWWCWSPTE